MPIQHGIWKIGDKPQALKTIQMDSEELLEEQIFKDISILNANWLLIGRQVYTDFGKPLDLLAIDASGSLVVIELKKHKTPRDVVAQTIEYASWVEELTADDLVQIYRRFAEKYGIVNTNFDQVYRAKFGIAPVELEKKSAHQMVVVAAELDESTERIVNYLNDKNILVNVVFFSVFEDKGNQYLSRAWMIDPNETEERAINVGEKEPWNGEFYVSFGIDGHRSWDDARKYGFISAGGGRWYTQGLSNLEPGDRVWVKNPGTGFIGVAKVIERVKSGSEFLTANMTLNANYLRTEDVGEDNAEYFVPVEWIVSVDDSAAFNEIGLFGNQHIVCKPRAAVWPHTVERLKEAWSID
ncbi:MAG: hypothetical protein ACI9SP_000249 [Arenicella sp.]|jgi:hypothetical protein